MSEEIEAGSEHEFTFSVPENKTIPDLFPESDKFQQMPEVLATGYFVGLIEWACMEHIHEELDWPEEQTVGAQMEFTHEAPTPPGCDITITTSLTDVDGSKLVFEFDAEDEIERIGGGTHTRFIVDRDGFAAAADKDC